MGKEAAVGEPILSGTGLSGSDSDVNELNLSKRSEEAVI